mmetsp:Transcript_68434/g.165508  ORF Transcript_68434/g.165508 Transcript_68434/m.165508 type:complete len:228 (-) Transcript_68434:121-804(-)
MLIMAGSSASSSPMDWGSKVSSLLRRGRFSPTSSRAVMPSWLGGPWGGAWKSATSSFASACVAAKAYRPCSALTIGSARTTCKCTSTWGPSRSPSSHEVMVTLKLSSLRCGALVAYVACSSKPISLRKTRGSMRGTGTGMRVSLHQMHRTITLPTVAPDLVFIPALSSPESSASSSAVCCNSRPFLANSLQICFAPFCSSARQSVQVLLPQPEHLTRVPGTKGSPSS